MSKKITFTDHEIKALKTIYGKKAFAVYEEDEETLASCTLAEILDHLVSLKPSEDAQNEST